MAGEAASVRPMAARLYSPRSTTSDRARAVSRMLACPDSTSRKYVETTIQTKRPAVGNNTASTIHRRRPRRVMRGIMPEGARLRHHGFRAPGLFIPARAPGPLRGLDMDFLPPLPLLIAF